MPAAVVRRRRTRYDTPAYAQRFDLSSPQGWDALDAHEHARKIESGTDPDTIDDPDVREHFLQLEQERFDQDDASPSSGGLGSQDSLGGGRGNRGRQGRPRSSSPSTRRSSGAVGRVDVDDASGFLLGLALYAIVVSALRDPVSASNGVKSWFRAKFLNITAATQQSKLTQTAPDVTGLALLTAPLTATNATPVQPPAPANLGQLLHQGLPTIPAPKPPAPAGAGT